jgi:hypothetical protein
MTHTGAGDLRSALQPLTRRQKTVVVVGLAIMLALQTVVCYGSGLALHEFGHVF